MSIQTRLTDLTIEDLRLLIRTEMKQLIRETVHETLDELFDDEDSWQLKAEVESYLKLPMEEKGPFYTLEEVKRELNLDE